MRNMRIGLMSWPASPSAARVRKAYAHHDADLQPDAEEQQQRLDVDQLRRGPPEAGDQREDEEVEDEDEEHRLDAEIIDAISWLDHDRRVPRGPGGHHFVNRLRANQLEARHRQRLTNTLVAPPASLLLQTSPTDCVRLRESQLSKVSWAVGHSGVGGNHSGMPCKDGTTPTGGTTSGYFGHGTINNCAIGFTPWGTYLTCEENFNGYFGERRRADAHRRSRAALRHRRHGAPATAGTSTTSASTRRSTRTSRTASAGSSRSIRSIPPATPVKRTALGRFKHEGAVRDAGAGRPRRRLHGRRRALRVHLQVRQRRAATTPGNRAGQSPTCSTTARSTSPASTPTAPAEWLPLRPEPIGLDGGRCATTRTSRAQRRRRAGQDPDQDPHGRRRGGRHDDGPPGVDRRRRIRGFDGRGVLHADQQQPPRHQPASTNSPDGHGRRLGARPAPGCRQSEGRQRLRPHHPLARSRKVVTATTFTWDLFAQCGDTATTKTPALRYEGNIATARRQCRFGAPDGLWFDHSAACGCRPTRSGTPPVTGSTLAPTAWPAPTRLPARLKPFPDRPEQSRSHRHRDDGRWPHPVRRPRSTPAKILHGRRPDAVPNWPRQPVHHCFGRPAALPAGRPRSGVVVITRNDGGIVGA